MAKKSHSPQVLPSPSLPASESFDKLPASIEDAQQHAPMMPTIQCCSLCTSPTPVDTASSDRTSTTTAPNANTSIPDPDQKCTDADPAFVPAPHVLHGGRHAARGLSMPLPVIQINGEPVDKDEGTEKNKKGKGKAKIPTGNSKPVARHDDWLRNMERALNAKAGISG